jgi:2-phosphosulfolactate phosphatase
MRIERADLETCHIAAGAVVVIDVIRAFTTAAYAFASGARDIVPVGTIEEALALRERFPGALAMGEMGGWRPEGFDFGNSPSTLIGRDLSGRRLIQRTGAGTQGCVRSLRAETMLACSLVCAGATARYLRRLAPDSVTLVATGVFPDQDGDEDVACADYLEALLRGATLDPAPFARRVYQAEVARLFTDSQHPAFPSSDLDYCAAVDRFDFAMLVERRDGLLVMEAIREGTQS